MLATRNATQTQVKVPGVVLTIFPDLIEVAHWSVITISLAIEQDFVPFFSHLASSSGVTMDAAVGSVP